MILECDGVCFYFIVVVKIVVVAVVVVVVVVKICCCCKDQCDACSMFFLCESQIKDFKKDGKPLQGCSVDNGHTKTQHIEEKY